MANVKSRFRQVFDGSRLPWVARDAHKAARPHRGAKAPADPPLRP